MSPLGTSLPFAALNNTADLFAGERNCRKHRPSPNPRCIRQGPK